MRSVSKALDRLYIYCFPSALVATPRHPVTSRVYFTSRGKKCDFQVYPHLGVKTILY
jgi:hypothetical protein